MKARSILPGNRGHHAVQIYADDNALRGPVADFLGDGLAAAQPTLVVATACHCDLIVRELSGRRFDIAALLASGSMLLLDVHELLDVVTTNSHVDSVRFRESVGVAVERVTQGTADRVVRVYGELVDVFWRSGDVESALKVEALCNELLRKYSLSLLCGYAMTLMTHPAHEKVCACHTDVYHAAATM
jgi:hypothetical protein